MQNERTEPSAQEPNTFMAETRMLGPRAHLERLPLLRRVLPRPHYSEFYPKVPYLEFYPDSLTTTLEGERMSGGGFAFALSDITTAFLLQHSFEQHLCLVLCLVRADARKGTMSSSAIPGDTQLPEM